MVVPQLIPELWCEIMKWLDVNAENWIGKLDWIVEGRLLCRGFAQATKQSIESFDLNTRRFFERLQLGQLYRMRRTPRGTQLYSNAICQLYKRFHTTRWLEFHQNKKLEKMSIDERNSFAHTSVVKKMAADEKQRHIMISEYFDTLFCFLKEKEDFDNHLDVFLVNLHDRYWLLGQRLESFTTEKTFATSLQEAMHRRRSIEA